METTFAPLSRDIRIITIFDNALPHINANSLVAQDGSSNIIVARQPEFAPVLARYLVGTLTAVNADVAFAVSASPTHIRSSAWFTSDDNGGGVPFTLDHATLHHRYENIHPGTVALHLSSTSLVALHEFGHATSSWTNGQVIDLYVDNNPGLNNKLGRPMPAQFGTYNATPFKSDPSRDRLGYPPGWQSYHCELKSPAYPAVMDNFWQSSTVPENCEHDAITGRFWLDRIQSIMARP